MPHLTETIIDTSSSKDEKYFKQYNINLNIITEREIDKLKMTYLIFEFDFSGRIHNIPPNQIHLAFY
jgi:hypothetical protein